jgi:hypothetical protein
MSASKLDHNECAASLQRHVEAPTKGLLKNFLTMVDRAGGGKSSKKMQSDQGRLVAFAMRVCGRIFADATVDASLVARTQALCGSFIMPLLERDMTRGDVDSIFQASRAIVGFVAAQGEGDEWMVQDACSAGLWNYPHSVAPLLQLVNSATGIVAKLANERGPKSQSGLLKDQSTSDMNSLSPSATPTSSVAAAVAVSKLIEVPGTITLGLAATAVVEAARMLCSRSNSHSASIIHSIALQFVSLCTGGDALWDALSDAASAHLLQVMSSFLCDAVALGGRNVELSVARAVACAGAESA